MPLTNAGDASSSRRTIEIDVGGVRVRLRGTVDEASVRHVLQTLKALEANPFCGHVFVFRGRRGGLLKMLWFDGQGLPLLAKRLERDRFIWPQAQGGKVWLTPAQLSMLLEGIDWRMPMRTHQSALAA
ncbi:IS66 family insertion sequence element accessory protein TnpB [Variovorax ginsengisoli]|uniref:Transposase n=1 Tax=Variovorax ginsengisoli TaxID=363844 RepID=A0ABT9SDC4_9BURK|nr:IS66 family insertion sequence element accessory protein TnpB [Variovorax ginsengisoli]MDP9902355.1 transposase [Variovorax ginsengisoli]